MLMAKEYLEDLQERLQEEPETTFSGTGMSKEQIMSDSKIMERLWVLFQKSVEEYESEPESAFRDALHDVLGIDLANKNPSAVPSKRADRARSLLAETIGRLWTTFQESVAESECDAKQTFCAVVHDVLGVETTVEKPSALDESRFLLVKTVERDSTMKVFPSLKEAQNEMIRQVQSEYEEAGGDEFEDMVLEQLKEGCGQADFDEFGVAPCSAYASFSDNIDWSIFVLDGQTSGDVPEAQEKGGDDDD